MGDGPLLVLLQIVDPNMLFGRNEGGRVTPLHLLAELADPFDYSTHDKQLILVKQLIKYGADVNAVSNPDGLTPLYYACFKGYVTNLDFVELLLEEGADPNFQVGIGLTPLMFTRKFAPGAAEFFAELAYHRRQYHHSIEETFLARVRMDVKHFSDESARPGSTDRVQHHSGSSIGVKSKRC
jgi:ankyrin repeat protein